MPTPRERGSILPFLILALVVGAAAFFGWREYDRRQKARLARQAEYERLLAEQEARAREAEAARAAGRTNVVVAVTNTVAAPKAVVKKTALDVWTEREATRKTVLAQVAEARKKPDARPLNGFAGIRFGEPLKADEGAAVRWGTVLDEDAGGSVATRGAAFAVYGPTLKKPFMSLGARPLVWVTPKTHRPYRIEFARALRHNLKATAPAKEGTAATAPALPQDAETTNLIAFLSTRFKATPFTTRAPAVDAPGCEYVFPLASSTIVVAEDDGRLVFSVEREDIRAEAVKEAEALRAEEKPVAEADGKALASKRYPHRPIDRAAYRGVKFQDVTPRSFCGVVFAAPPPEGVAVVVPQKGPKGFFLDYEWAKCAPFRGFSRGRADIDSKRGGVYALTLFSAGGEGGLDDKDYFDSVRAALTAHFKVEPKAAIQKADAAALPAPLVYLVGDLEITFAPDPRGGFTLRAENKVLADLAAAKKR